MYDTVVKILAESWLVFGQMAPYLLFGFLVAGVLSVCISPVWVERHLGRRGLGPVLRAALYGVPLPLCSCGVIPVGASIRRHGASPAATTAFLLSTPQTGVDSIVVTYALLGPVLAVFRPIAALLTGVLGGGLVLLFGGSDTSREPRPPACNDACCSDGAGRGRVRRVLGYGFVTLPRDLGSALVVGVLIAGAMSALIPQDQLKTVVGGGIVSILLLMAAGVPVYVCATASVPIAAGFLHMGASPGAAMAFLIAGPATNAAAFTTLWKVLGRKIAIIYLLTVAASAMGGGLVLDWWAPGLEGPWARSGEHVHLTGAGGWFSNASAVILMAVLAFSCLPWFRRLVGGKEADSGMDTSGASAPGGRHELRVTGMKCSHCAESVKRALTGCAGVRSAEVDAASGRAVVVGDPVDRDRLVAEVRKLGFGVESKA